MLRVSKGFSRTRRSPRGDGMMVFGGVLEEQKQKCFTEGGSTSTTLRRRIPTLLLGAFLQRTHPCELVLVYNCKTPTDDSPRPSLPCVRPVRVLRSSLHAFWDAFWSCFSPVGAAFFRAQVPHRGGDRLHVSVKKFNRGVNAAIGRLTKTTGAGWQTIQSSINTTIVRGLLFPSFQHTLLPLGPTCRRRIALFAVVAKPSLEQVFF